jgi:hypothetical protein
MCCLASLASVLHLRLVVCVQVGNTGPVQEFNIQVDPEAAKVVFEAGACAAPLAAHHHPMHALTSTRCCG